MATSLSLYPGVAMRESADVVTVEAVLGLLHSVKEGLACCDEETGAGGKMQRLRI